MTCSDYTDFSHPYKLNKPTLQLQMDQSQPFISSLPPETLAVIFGEFCQSGQLGDTDTTQNELAFNRAYDKHGIAIMSSIPKPQLLLGAVCRSWREVTWASPSLWATVRLDIQVHNKARQALFLQLHLEKSGTLPLSMSFLFAHKPENFIPSPELVDPVIDPLLRKHQHRIMSLYLRDPPESWASYVSEIPHLQTFLFNSCKVVGHEDTVWWAPLPDDTTDPDSSRHFARKIALSPASSKRIMRLSLVQVPMDICAELLLRQCPNLVEFRCRSPLKPKNAPTPWLVSQITLPNIEFLDWSWSMAEWATSIIDNVQFPCLRTLLWGESIRTIETLKFFRRLPTTLRTIEFYSLKDSDVISDSPIRFLREPHLNVKNLVFSYCSRKFIEATVISLTSGPDVVQGLPLPHLSSISVRDSTLQKRFRSLNFAFFGQGQQNPMGEDLLEISVIEMLEARRGRGVNSGFQLVDESGEFKWPSHLQERLERLEPASRIIRGSRASNAIASLYYP